METSLKAGEKQFGSIDFERREPYISIKGICEKSDKKMNIFLKSEKMMINLKQSNKLPKIKDFSIRKPKIDENQFKAGSGKHMGYKYNPNDFFFPIHKMVKRNGFGQPFIY